VLRGGVNIPNTNPYTQQWWWKAVAMQGRLKNNFRKTKIKNKATFFKNEFLNAIFKNSFKKLFFLLLFFKQFCVVVFFLLE